MIQEIRKNTRKKRTQSFKIENKKKGTEKKGIWKNEFIRWTNLERGFGGNQMN